MKIPFFSKETDESYNNDNIIQLAVEKIVTNPYQPRNKFNQSDIEELAASIENFGVIQPITVRKKADKYELIAGERRLRAAKFNGNQHVPVIIREFTDQETAEIALVENLQRKDLDFIEEAVAYARLLDEFGLTQQELADKVGKSQSTIANKLRILKLDKEVLKEINDPIFSERQARALLKITEKEQQLKVVELIKKNKWTVRETESYIKKVLQSEKVKPKRKIKRVYGDLRIFVNTLDKTLAEIRQSGLEVKVDKDEAEEYIEYRIRLPRN